MSSPSRGEICPQSRVKQRIIVYIGRHNLYHGLKDKYGRKYMWLNLLKLSEKLVRDWQTLICVKYFTTMVKEPESKVRRQRRFISVLNTFPENRFLMFEGRFQLNDVTCPAPNCGHVFRKPEEKKTDVCISVEMVKDAYKNLCDWEFLLSADSDLVPAVEAVREAGCRVFSIFPPGRNSAELRQCSDGQMTLGKGLIRSSLLDDPFITPEGKAIGKPIKWS